MICIDPRAGSKNLPNLFPSDMVAVFELPAADIMLTNQDGSEIWTLVEHKRIDDVLQCIMNGRFAGTQLPAMAEMCDDYWLLVEGPFKESGQGELLVESRFKGQWYRAHVGNRYFNYSDFETWCITMQTLTPLKIKITQSRQETRSWINTLHYWWEKGKDRHHSHMKLDKSQNFAELTHASLVREWAERLPGVGHQKAVHVDMHFADAFEMVVAEPSEWVKIEGVGEKMAERIYNKIRGNNGR